MYKILNQKIKIKKINRMINKKMNKKKNHNKMKTENKIIFS